MSSAAMLLKVLGLNLPMVPSIFQPSNIVIDLSGNLRITGYGLGRRANCDSVSSEFSAGKF